MTDEQQFVVICDPQDGEAPDVYGAWETIPEANEWVTEHHCNIEVAEIKGTGYDLEDTKMECLGGLVPKDHWIVSVQAEA